MFKTQFKGATGWLTRVSLDLVLWFGGSCPHSGGRFSISILWFNLGYYEQLIGGYQIDSTKLINYHACGLSRVVGKSHSLV